MYFEDDPYPQLVSPRSPSYERASREFWHSSFTDDPQMIATLAMLSEAEHNASEACTIVASTMADPVLASRVRERAATHDERRQALGALIEAAGGSPPTPEECRTLLVGGLEAAREANSEASATQALRVLRGELRACYDHALATAVLTGSQRAALVELAPPALEPRSTASAEK